MKERMNIDKEKGNMKKRNLKEKRRKIIRRILFSIFIAIIIIGAYLILVNATSRADYVQKDNIIEQENEKKIQSLISEAEKFKNSYYIDEAIELLQSDESLINNEEIIKKIDSYKAYKESFIKYEGPIEHIFFHSLIVYPELAFDNIGHDANGYNMWFVTIDEFKGILPLLHNNGYVVIDITEIFKKNNEGKMVQQEIYLPGGKKPLIISQDDVNYYKYMSKDGFADKLVVDSNNEISTVVRTPEGEEQITRDGDIVPILDDYIKENLGFSYKGEKGILVVTGYEGVLGYRIDSEGSKDEAKRVVNRLKETGWRIASHSYTHNGTGYFGENPQYDKLESDFEKWKIRIEPIVGETNIYIAPFGVTLQGNNYELVEKYGFEIYCNVSRISTTTIKDNSVITPRFNIDGFTFFRAKESVDERFFDVNKVIDNSRPTLK